MDCAKANEELSFGNTVRMHRFLLKFAHNHILCAFNRWWYRFSLITHFYRVEWMETTYAKITHYTPLMHTKWTISKMIPIIAAPLSLISFARFCGYAHFGCIRLLFIKIAILFREMSLHLWYVNHVTRSTKCHFYHVCQKVWLMSSQKNPSVTRATIQKFNLPEMANRLFYRVSYQP